METSTNLGRVSLVPRGEYDPAIQYERLDIVRYDGSGYLVLRPVQGVTPVDGADYMLITERGGIGATGATGPQGEQGIQGAQGEKGVTGDPGSSIASIERTTGTGAPGTRDTYTITLTDGSTSSFEVYNGADGIGAGDMTAAVYDPQGKAQDIFKYVDDHTQPDAVTVAGGGEIEMEESLGEGPYTFEYAPEEDGSAVQASQVGYDSTESGLEAETVQGALDRLSAVKVDVGRVSNPNLLDTWYFVDPINQRGLAEYGSATGNVYCIDRFRMFHGICHIKDDCIELSTPEGGTPSGLGFYQQKENMADFYDGKIMTVSALVKSLNGEELDISIGHGPRSSVFTPILTSEKYSGTIDTPFPITVTGQFIKNAVQPLAGVSINMVTGSAEIIAAKLEMGPVQTLARQDESGTWVLNDPPPDPTLELAKCQRYQVITNTEYSPFVLTAVSTNMLFGSIVFATKMRIKPAVSDLILRRVKDGQLTHVTSFALQGTADGIFSITNIAPSTLIAGEMYQIMASFDANL